MSTIRAAYLEPSAACRLGAMRWALFLATFSALAVGLPYACHQFGLAGVVFLPMHFAVLIAALVMGLRGGVIVALISPTLSYALSAMPPAPSLLPMTIELATYAVAVHLAVRRGRMPVILALVVAMLAGRLAALAAVGILLPGVSLAAQLRSMFVVGIPGIAIQLALVPPLAARIAGALKAE